MVLPLLAAIPGLLSGIGGSLAGLFGSAGGAAGALGTAGALGAETAGAGALAGSAAGAGAGAGTAAGALGSTGAAATGVGEALSGAGLAEGALTASEPLGAISEAAMIPDLANTLPQGFDLLGEITGKSVMPAGGAGGVGFGSATTGASGAGAASTGAEIATNPRAAQQAAKLSSALDGLFGPEGKSTMENMRMIGGNNVGSEAMSSGPGRPPQGAQQGQAGTPKTTQPVGQPTPISPIDSSSLGTNLASGPPMPLMAQSRGLLTGQDTLGPPALFYGSALSGMSPAFSPNPGAAPPVQFPRIFNG